MKYCQCLLCILLFCSLSLSGSGLVKFAEGKGGALLLTGECLYAVLDGTLCTYDISVPQSPRLVHKTPAAGNRQMVSGEKYLYLSCRSRGVEIFSLEKPQAPRKVSHFYPSELATGLALSGNILAVTLRIYGVEFFDVSDPLKVRPLGLLRTAEAQSAAFFGNGRIAIGDWAARRVFIGDASDPAAPVPLALAKLDGFGDGVTVREKYLYAATGMHSAVRGPRGAGKGNGLEIFDISDPKNPRRTGVVKFKVNPSGFPDWWSVRVSGNTAFIANAANGVYVVDVADKSRPEILRSVKLPGDSASQIAIGKGTVYVSGHSSGLYLFRDPRAGENEFAPSKITVPRTAPVRPAVKGLRHLALPGFVWTLARWGNRLYAACGQEGLKEFSIAPDGSLRPERTFAGIAMDCAVSEKLLVIAADQYLKIIEQATGKILSMTKAPGKVPFLQLRLFGDRLYTGGRTGKLNAWDISDPAVPKRQAEFSGGGILYGDMLPERSVKGIFPVNWHSRFVRWINKEGKECGSIPALHRHSYQQNGITEVNGKFLLIGKKEAYLLSPEAPGKFVRIPMKPCRIGIPTSDGDLIAVSDRRNGRISFYRFDGKEMKECRERRIQLPFTLTGRVIFYKGKVYIPAGLCGIYYE